MDSGAMMGGFVLARRWPIWLIVALSLAMEIFTMYMIRDGLTLNVINLIHQFDFIQAWQSRM